ncbi:hypothetical protein A9239_06475 [Methanosarcina sp. A14]|uniref:Mannose-6-phosphate isomerase n=1 Tax=Methanosarcina barkeri MS TaxID=1434108 RepID=A0A0E3LNX5_METBA|nr:MULTISPECIES: hypothetical protein [Methanosarcina]AKB55531.1 Mannose-6-phosphate isomerase [Methanosarcina barkeri MS]OED12296.1 hypothetical protein A9239_06475 [Methanosarcina sp. A14]
MQPFTRYEEIEPYITKDGSIIRELMHPSVHGNSNQSLAEATVPAGGKTLLHKHHLTEDPGYNKALDKLWEETSVGKSPMINFQGLTYSLLI